MNFKSQLRFT